MDPRTLFSEDLWEKSAAAKESSVFQDPFSLESFSHHVEADSARPMDPFSLSAFAQDTGASTGLLTSEALCRIETKLGRSNSKEDTKAAEDDPFEPSNLGRQLSALSAGEDFCRQETEEGWPMWVASGDCFEFSRQSSNNSQAPISAPALIAPPVWNAGDASTSSTHGFTESSINEESQPVQVPLKLRRAAPEVKAGAASVKHEQPQQRSETDAAQPKRHRYRRKGNSLISLAHQEQAAQRKTFESDLKTMTGSESQGDMNSTMLFPPALDVVREDEDAGPDDVADDGDVFEPGDICRQDTDDPWPVWSQPLAEMAQHADDSLNIPFLPPGMYDAACPSSGSGDSGLDAGLAPHCRADDLRSMYSVNAGAYADHASQMQAAKRGGYRRKGNSLISQAFEESVQLTKQATGQQGHNAKLDNMPLAHNSMAVGHGRQNPASMLLHQQDGMGRMAVGQGRAKMQPWQANDLPKAAMPQKKPPVFKFCPQCGYSLLSCPKAAFCPKCGLDLGFLR